MLRIIAPVLFLAFWASTACAEPLRVMTFNVMCGLCGPLEYGGWDDREAGLIDTMRRADPDLLVTQEMMATGNLETVRRALPALEAHYLDRGFAALDSVVFFNRERFAVIEKGAFWLSRSPDAALGLGWWALSVPRSVAWVRLRDRRTGGEFYFAGTHVDARRTNKQPSVELIRQRLAARADLPVILAGDFNFQPDTHFARSITTASGPGPGFVDAFDLRPRLNVLSNRPTSAEFGCTESRAKRFPGCRIDYVFLDGNTRWQVGDYTIDTYRYGWRNQFISDHRAVWVDLDWEPVRTRAASEALPDGAAGRD